MGNGTLESRGRSFSLEPCPKWMTAEAKNLAVLLRDEYERTKKMPLLRRYQEMDRILEQFTADDVLHKLLVLTGPIFNDGSLMNFNESPRANGSQESNYQNRAQDFFKNSIDENESLVNKRNNLNKLQNARQNSRCSHRDQSNSVQTCEENSKKRPASKVAAARSNRQRRHGIVQNVIMSHEIPEFQIPPRLATNESNTESRMKRRKDKTLDESDSYPGSESSSLSDSSRAHSIDYAYDSGAVPGFFTNNILTFESLNIERRCSNAIDIVDLLWEEAQSQDTRRSSGYSICQEKHLQELDLASLGTFPGLAEMRATDLGRPLRLFVYNQFLGLQNGYRSLVGKNFLMRYRKMKELLESCGKACARLR